MKKIITFVAIALVLGGCKKEAEPVVKELNEIGYLPPAGNYFPTTNGSYWLFDLNQTPTADTLRSLRDGSWNGQTFRILEDTVSNAEKWVRQSGEAYYHLEAALPGVVSDSTGLIEITSLRTDLGVEGKWFNKFLMVDGDSLIVEGSIEEVEPTRRVRSVPYPDVVKVRHRYSIKSEMTTTQFLTNYTWFAKGIGPVEIQTGSENQRLVTYSIQ